MQNKLLLYTISLHISVSIMELQISFANQYAFSSSSNPPTALPFSIPLLYDFTVSHRNKAFSLFLWNVICINYLLDNTREKAKLIDLDVYSLKRY